MLRNLKNFNLPEIEEKVLQYWKQEGVFEKTLARRKKGTRFNFYEGPPYANGRPGIHHVLARVFKDIVLRYKSMRGFYVPRRAGWDTHGLPIELEAEKQLGIKSKKEIEKFGIALFNRKAKESVWQYKDEWERMTERIGYWLDLKNAYVTYTTPYVESLWWVFKQAAGRGYLSKSYKIVPFCPRCQTPLASHELGMPGVYKRVPDPSIFVRFRLKGRKSESLLVWTTTPWTLPANVAVALNPKFTYTKFSVSEGGKREFIWSYSPPPGGTGRKVEVVEKISGQKLIGLEYEPLYQFRNPHFDAGKFYKVLGADFVSTEEGTGFVHIAPAFGEDDLSLFKRTYKDLSWESVPVTVDDAGHVMHGYPGAGKFIKEADKDILADLEERNFLYQSGILEHEYPFCWRCGTALIYFARTSWFFEMSRLREKLVEGNKTINWIPAHIKEGRFGEWIREAKDWAISRDRFWGTPLPVWECGECKEAYIAGSLKDLQDRDYFGNTFTLVRHTQAEHNLKEIIAAGPEKASTISELTPKGIRDLEALAKKLKRKKVDIIYASPYKRAKDTAEAIGRATGAEVRIDERLQEINCGIFNWRPIGEHKKFFDSPLEEFVKTPPGGENLTDVKKRVFDFALDANQRHRNAHILVVSHGDPLWMLEAALRHVSNEEALALSYLMPGDAREVAFLNVPSDERGEIDLHRPFVDHVFLSCGKCGGRMSRVREVADVWFDSGAMPFASGHFPFEAKRKSAEPEGYPADYICEAVDQTRGWFYTLLAVSALLERPAPFRNVICLGLILDKHGQKMSKSKGNIVNPWEVIGKYGVDSVRWYFYTVNPPGEPKLFDEAEVAKAMRRFVMIIYNSYVFYETYARPQVLRKPKSVLDRWILARLAETTKVAGDHLDAYHIGEAAKALEGLVDDISRWYIRRSRRRLQKPVSEADYKEASATLGFVLAELAKLIAPFMPFFAEALYSSLGSKGSVHLADWPRERKEHADEDLLSEMTWVREAAALALAKRAEAGIKVRQPLASLAIKKKAGISKELVEILKDEINVKEVVFNPDLEEEARLDTAITQELREEGLIRELTRMVQELRQGAGYKPKDRVRLFIEAGRLGKIFERYEAALMSEVGAEEIDFKRTSKFDAEIETKIEDEGVWIAVKKV